MPKRNLPKSETAEQDLSFPELLDKLSDFRFDNDAIDLNYYLGKIQYHLYDEKSITNKQYKRDDASDDIQREYFAKLFVDRLSERNEGFISRVLSCDLIKPNHVSLLEMIDRSYPWVFFLLKSSVHPEYRVSPLHSAALFHQDRAIKILLRNGYDSNLRDDQGRTPDDYHLKQHGYNLFLEFADASVAESAGLISSLINTYSSVSSNESLSSGIKMAKHKTSSGATLFKQPTNKDAKKIKLTWEEDLVDKENLVNEGFGECLFAYKVNLPLDPQATLISFMLLKTDDDQYMFWINQSDRFEDINAVEEKLSNDLFNINTLLKKFKLYDSLVHEEDMLDGVYYFTANVDQMRGFVDQFILAVDSTLSKLSQADKEVIKSSLHDSMDYRPN